jgi:hypothetical protein
MGHTLYTGTAYHDETIPVSTSVVGMPSEAFDGDASAALIQTEGGDIRFLCTDNDPTDVYGLLLRETDAPLMIVGASNLRRFSMICNDGESGASVLVVLFKGGIP